MLSPRKLKWRRKKTLEGFYIQNIGREGESGLLSLKHSWKRFSFLGHTVRHALHFLLTFSRLKYDYICNSLLSEKGFGGGSGSLFRISQQHVSANPPFSRVGILKFVPLFS